MFHSKERSASSHKKTATTSTTTSDKTAAVASTTAGDYNETGRISSTHKIPPAPSTGFANFSKDFLANCSTFSQVLEGDGKPMMHYPRLTFNNWGLTVSNTPTDTFAARTKVGVCNLVKWAASVGRSVRCAGFRHSWRYLYPTFRIYWCLT
jgi:hypothetical protein